MKFDVVVGNPPYNNDIYIPFVEMGHSLASTCSVFITPAKWQAKGGEKNEEFRQNIVPHMSKIVYYEDETDVFAIKSIGGIAYYLVDKNKEYKNKYIKNRQDRISEFNNSMTREYRCKDTLNNFGYTVINKILQVENLGFPLSKNDTNKRYYVSGSNMTGHSNGRGKIGWFSTDANVQCTCKADIYDRQNNETNKSTVAYTIFSSNDRKECEYFNSYIDTKFVRALVMFGVCETGCFSDNNWRFVPDPGAFDHIFTDEELYKKYNLTPEEINIIESVIKERK